MNIHEIRSIAKEKRIHDTRPNISLLAQDYSRVEHTPDRKSKNMKIARFSKYYVDKEIIFF